METRRREMEVIERLLVNDHGSLDALEAHRSRSFTPPMCLRVHLRYIIHILGQFRESGTPK